MVHILTLLKFALWILIFLRAPTMLDKKVYFLCLDYIMFVYLIVTVPGIFHIRCLHIKKKFTCLFKTEESAITFLYLLC